MNFPHQGTAKYVELELKKKKWIFEKLVGFSLTSISVIRYWRGTQQMQKQKQFGT